ncbi:hypothetical protein, partial [uncultured Coprobacter sp.]|uniref:hypothetical protein n=1 Tax=uncultured Coprobacter sp. TaxID=1720550 RepID=UPI00260FA279
MMNGLGNLGHLGKLGHVSTSGMNHLEVEASGRAFPIWNTKVGDDKLLSLSIHGLTEQSGTPTPANPVPMRSVGDTGLLLSVMADKECSDYQLLNIKAAMNKAGHDGILRSVNGIYDEVVYDGKKWKLIQRIGVSTGFTVTSISTINTNGDLREVLIRGLVKGTQVTPDVSVFYSNKFYYTGDSTSNKWNNVYGVYTNSLRYGFYVVYDINDYPTEDDLKAMIEDESTIYYYVLFTPIEYPLDLPVITTYDEQTYFASNAAEAKPRMVAQCKVSKALDYIREGLIGYYTGRGRSNDDENKNILPDLSGNGNDLENKNFAYTINSGYGDGYIQYDGIDDFSMLPLGKNFKSGVKAQMFVFSATQSTTETDNKWNGGIVREHYFAIQRNQVPAKSDYEQVYLNGTDVKTTGFKINGSTEINTIVISKTKNVSDFNKNLNISTILNAPVYCIKQRFHDALLYDRILTEEEIQHNYKVSCQYNGEDINGKSEETTASGDNGFTVYNSLPGIFKELTVYGKSIQDGTPTPANPIPIKSVGDTPLILIISNGTETQQINFGDIKLRSVGTVSDELVFDNSVGKWKLMQRIKEYSVDDLSTPGNYSFKNWESGDNVHYAIYYKTPQDDLVSNTNSPFMSDYSDKPFWPGTIQKGVGYYFGELCFSMLNGETTETEALSITKGRHYQGLLITPIETELDFESPKTFSGEVMVTTNQETVHPYMTARIAVGEKLVLPADPLAVYISGKQTTEDNTFKDQSGNGNDIPLYNLAHSAESGFFQGALHLDGVDDTGRLPLESFNPAITAETSIFLSGKVNETGTKYFSYLRTRDGVSTALSRLIPGNTGLFIAYYPLSLTGNPDVNLLNSYKLTYNNNNMLDQLLSPANKTYYNLAGFLQGGSQVELGKLDYRYLIIYPRNLTEEEQA